MEVMWQRIGPVAADKINPDLHTEHIHYDEGCVLKSIQSI